MVYRRIPRCFVQSFQRSVAGAVVWKIRTLARTMFVNAAMGIKISSLESENAQIWLGM